MKIVFYPRYKKTLNYFTKLLQVYMNLVIALVAILYQKVDKRKVLRNIEIYHGSLILLIQKNGSVSPNNYEAAQILSIFLNSFYLTKHLQILQELF